MKPNVHLCHPTVYIRAMDRRDFLRYSSITALGGFNTHLSPDATASLERLLDKVGSIDSATLAADDPFWLSIRQSYITSSELIDLDNANTAPTPAAVFDSYVDNGQRLRQAPSERFGKVWSEVDAEVRPALARYLGAKPAEVIITPNATYGLNTVLFGFPMEKGDEIIVTNHEYPDMVESVLQRGKREGIVMRTVNVPTPERDRMELVGSIEHAITPKTRLILISHVSAWSGEILPVKEVVRAARARGVAVLVDGAQSVGIIPVSFAEMDADFLATSLHKWVGAPMGTGALLMKTEHFGRVWPLNPPSWDTGKHPADRYEWTGTFNMAAYRSISDALQFQMKLGSERKQKRVRYLGDYWMEKIARVPGVNILTPLDTARSFGVASFMIDGISAEKVVKDLRLRQIIVQDKSGRHSPFTNAIRVSPGVYATTRELDRFVAAIREIARGIQPADSE